VTIWFYVKTNDEPKDVGTVVCNANYAEGKHPEDKYSWVMEEGRDEPGYWEIKGVYAPLKELSTVGIVYRVGDTVVLSEIDDALAPNVADPLIEKYGFDKVKWLTIVSQK
jgi:hypothetical protein